MTSSVISESVCSSTPYESLKSLINVSSLSVNLILSNNRSDKYNSDKQFLINFYLIDRFSTDFCFTNLSNKPNIQVICLLNRLISLYLKYFPKIFDNIDDYLYR